jgi:hypothetical protein
MAFGQTICGFDMLRVNGKSYVIDVNGWSFVKGSEEYDELCARVLSNIFSKIVKPKILSHSRQTSIIGEDDGMNHWVLKGYINVLRHADRTPKLKYKIVVESHEFTSLSSYPDPEQKLKYVLLETRDILLKMNQDYPRYQRLKMLEEILRQKMHNPSTKAQTRPLKDGTTMLIIKWGGEFTHAGRHQARELGETIRKDLQVLNKKSLENVKVYCSVERRVQATADVFVKGLFKIAEVPTKAIANRPDLLDQASVAKDSLEQVKQKVSVELNKKRQGSPLNMKVLMEQFVSSLQQLRERMANSFQRESLYRMMMFRWCCSETPSLFRERWEKHFRDLLDASFIEPARISDLYDSLKYDAIHHREFLEYVFKVDENSQLLRTLYSTTQQLFAYLSPQETGTSSSEKIQVGLKIIKPLLNHILTELDSAARDISTRTRFYFTKESHMVALYNVLVHSGLQMSRRRATSVLFPEELTDDICWYGELDYLAQLCFELYEKRTLDEEGHLKKAFSFRIGMSQGAHDSHLLDLQLDERHFLSVSPKQWITPYIDGMEAIETLLNVVNNEASAM